MNLKMIGAGVVISTFAFGVSAETLELAAGETRTIESAVTYVEGFSVAVSAETHDYKDTYLKGDRTWVEAGAYGLYPNEPRTLAFPQAFGGYWIRAIASDSCTASVQLVYE